MTYYEKINANESAQKGALFKKATRGVKYVAIQNCGYRGVSLIVFIVLARLLTPESIGLVALSMVYIALLEIFLEQGFVEAIVQNPSIGKNFLDTAFWTNFLLSIVLFVISIVASPYISALFKEPSLSPIICGLAPLLIIRGSVSVHLALLNRAMAFDRLAVAAICGVVTGGATGIILAFKGFGIWSLVLYQIITRLIEAIVLWSQNSWHPGMNIKRSEFNRLFAFGVNVTGSRFINFFNRYGSDIVIGFFLGPVAVGYYNLAFRLSRGLVEMLGAVVSKVSFPFFSRLQDDPESGRHAFGRITEQISFLSFPFFIGMAVCAHQIVEVFFGAKWLPVVPVMRVLAIIGMLESLGYLNTAVFFGYGKPQWRLGLDVLNAITNMLIFVIAAQWSILAVACGYVIRGYIFAPIPLLGIKKLTGMTFASYFRNIFRPLIAVILMGIILLILTSFVVTSIHPLFLLLGQVILGGIIYTGITLFIFPEILQRTRQYISTSLTSNKGTTISKPK